MKLALLSGTANRPLADAIGSRLGCGLTECVVTRFPDGESHVEVRGSVRGCDVFVIQPTGPPANDHLMELLFLADACRRAGAERMTAVMPYFAYARQDRRARGREAVAARVVGDQLRTAGFERVVGVDIHTRAIEAILSVPLEHLSAVPMLAKAVQALKIEKPVIVAPDLGAAKLAERFSRALGLEMAIVRKTRISGTKVTVAGIVGEVRGRTPVIVDDMISTGGTVEAAARAAQENGAAEGVTVVVTHALAAGRALETLKGLPVERLITTDSVPLPPETGLPTTICGLDLLLDDAIRRLHGGESLDPLIRHE